MEGAGTSPREENVWDGKRGNLEYRTVRWTKIANELPDVDILRRIHFQGETWVTTVVAVGEK